jgi:pimeloyl-ACP methyl ester carboxylesterase
MSDEQPQHAQGAAAAASLGRAHYITLEPDPVFAVAHSPAGRERHPLGVLVCPPFGWDELCTYRSLRVWADLCARAGYPALRFDFPGTGDSGGSARDPARLEAWTSAVTAAAQLLRERERCERIVAMGIGLGGMVACRALAAGAPIDDLVLWSVPPRGSLLLRELRAFAGMVAAEVIDVDEGAHAAAEPDDGALEVAGFVLSAETIAELGQLDLTALAVPDAEGRRVLLLGRDTLAPDRRLREHFERSGVQLTVEDGPGYGAMMVDPQLYEIPHAAFSRILAWLAESSPGSAPVLDPPGRSAPITHRIELREGGVLISERTFEFDHRGWCLRGVLAEPVSPPAAGICAVLLNAGSVRRIGAHRMWVEDARRWAALGVPTLRYDLVGMGDSDGEERRYLLNTEFHRDGFSDQVLAALAALAAQGLPGPFVLCGVCSGAYWSFHAALADERVRGLLLVNLLAFFWSDELGAARDARRARALLREGSVREIMRIVLADRWRIARMARTKLSTLRRARGAEAPPRFGDEIAAALDQLRDRGVETLLLLGHGEPLYDDLLTDGLIERFERWPNLRLERIPIEDHMFRPAWAQRYVAGVLDRAIVAERRRVNGGRDG